MHFMSHVRSSGPRRRCWTGDWSGPCLLTAYSLTSTALVDAMAGGLIVFAEQSSSVREAPSTSPGPGWGQRRGTVARGAVALPRCTGATVDTLRFSIKRRIWGPARYSPLCQPHTWRRWASDGWQNGVVHKVAHPVAVVFWTRRSWGDDCHGPDRGTFQWRYACVEAELMGKGFGR